MRLKHTYYYQDAGWSAVIVWGGILSVLALAVVLRFETVGFSWSAFILTLTTLSFAGYQISRYRATVENGTLRLGRLLRGSTLTIPLTNVTVSKRGAHTIHLAGTIYGDFSFITWQRADDTLATLTHQD